MTALAFRSSQDPSPCENRGVRDDKFNTPLELHAV